MSLLLGGGLTGAETGTIADVVRAADLIGVLFNAMLGGVIAREERLDPVGFFALAVLSALGGGMIRDMMLPSGTPVALTDIAYITTAAIGSALVYLIPIWEPLWNRVFPWADAIALGAWAAAGAGKTLGFGLGWLPAIFLGTITAVGGGALRDVVLRRVPAIFGGNTLYAVPATVAATVQVVLWRTGYYAWGSVVTIVVGASLVLLAQHFNLVLPYGREVNVIRAVSRRVPRPQWRSAKPPAGED